MALDQKQLEMRAVMLSEFGGPEVLSVGKADIPDAQADELLVRVVATSVNPVDYKTRKGQFPMVTADKLPIIPGHDLAGVVELVGAPSLTFKVGDEVFGLRSHGTYAEFAVIRASEAARKPASLDMVETGCLPVAALTAWQGLFDHGQLQPGQRVLIQAGAGGVGHLAIQFAKAKGAEVVTTASAGNLDFVRELGADVAIDYKTDRLAEEAGQVDLVLDLFGGDAQDGLWSVVRTGGAFVSAVREPPAEKATEKQVRTVRMVAKPNAHQLTEIAALIDAGKVRVVVSKVFALDEIADAHRFAEAGGFRGKVGIRI